MSSDESLATVYGRLLVAVNEASAANDAAGFAAALAALNTAHQLRHAKCGPDSVAPQLRQLTLDAQAALERFRNEARLDELAEHEVPDARQRLDHVVKLTDEAAHRTLDLVERSGPLADHAARESAALAVLWRELSERHQTLFESREFATRVQTFLDRTRTDAEALRSNLSEVLMAQGYQDLTGQIIRGVTRLVAELEGVLGQLVVIASGGVPSAAAPARAPREAAAIAGLAPSLQQGVGPAVPGVSDAGAVTAQDDIDALLSGIAANGR
jgi:chemotaxis protein CheZ